MTAVLLVDDDAVLLGALRRVLGRMGWTVVCTQSGQEALHAMSRMAFDAIVSDLRMPGMDGASLLALVSERHPRTIRVVLTGDADEATVARAAAVAHATLQKPIQGTDLHDRVEALVAQARSRSGDDAGPVGS